ncbi:MAG: hypothetical protein HYU58_18755 [Proteobacteria bacterium]|nr:hypothetical protein [Pseudomonadota bacterium]
MKNSNRLILLGGVVGLMLGAAAPAFADFGLWQDADTNKDGAIDRTEFDAQGAARFKAIDANGDGFASADELKAFHEAQRAKFEAQKGDMAAKMIKRFDKDGDGKLSEAEWPGKGHMNFADADANKDGAVTTEEMAALRKAHDRGMPDGKDRMARLDTDKDGKISVAEWSAQGEKMFTRFDKNKDGKIAKDEVPQPRKRHINDDEPPVQP